MQIHREGLQLQLQFLYLRIQARLKSQVLSHVIRFQKINQKKISQNGELRSLEAVQCIERSDPIISS